MKKIILLVATVFSVAVTYAQDWYVGPMASLNLSGLTHAADVSTGTRVGYAFGAFGGYEFSDLFGIEAQLTYSSQGGKIKGETVDYTRKMNYINLPILAKFNVYKGITVLVGPQFGFNVRSKIKGEGNSADVKNETSVFDFGGMLGVAYQFKFGLRAGVSYTMGFTNTVTADAETLPLFGDPARNKVFAITVGWKF